MTEQQENHPIDEMYRKAFTSLPNTPSPAGWDTPSEKVWQQVQANLPRKGGATKWLLGAFAVLFVAAGAWFLIQNQNQPVPQPAVELSTPVAEPAKAPLESPSDQPNTTTTTEPNLSPSKPTISKPASSSSTPAKPNHHDAAQPLPGSKAPLPPNSLEGKRNKD